VDSLAIVNCVIPSDMLNLAMLAAMFLASDGVRFYGGTIIVMQKDENRFLIVADSRSSDNAGAAHWDDACKVISLGDQTFFFASGKTIATSSAGQSIFDLNDIPKRVFNDFSRLSNDEARLYSMAFYSAIFAKAMYQDIAAQQPTGLVQSVVNGNLVKAIMGGAMSDGSLVAYLININVEPTSTPVPLITFTVERFNPPVQFPIASFGSHEKDGVNEFIDNKTDRAKIANAKVNEEIARSKYADIELLRLKAAVASAIEWAENKNMVGGQLDILELRRGGRVNWIQHKEICK
jgi:hypothetical protein